VQRKAIIVARLLLTSLLLLWSCAPALAALAVKIGVLRELHDRETISILDVPANDDTFAGAQLGVADNNTTGKFTGQTFEVTDNVLDAGAGPEDIIHSLAESGVSLIVADLSAERLLAASKAASARGILLFNVFATDDRLRETDCRSNIVHVAPTRSMLADALAQYLVWKQWRRWLLIKGSHPEDELLAQAYRNSARKFGARIVEERIYEDTGGGRRSDSGSVQTQRQIPVLTQNAPAHDVVVAADESEVFAGYLPYHNWDPRPVVGSSGLVPKIWDASHEQWGAIQLQNRFVKGFHRFMNVRDHAAWLALRIIGEATTRTGTTDAQKLRAFMLSPDFSIAAFKGVRLSLRPWNQQLRQPILLADGRMIASVSPQEGFLHQFSELDTLGVDRPESKCKLQ